MPHLSRRQLIQTLGVTPFATWATPSAAAPLATFDVVVIGSGAAGMTAALSARQQGLSVIILEKASTFGGSTARSGAGIWVRNNEVLQAAGVVDTPAQAATYLDAVVGDEVSAERKAAYLAQGPAMISFILKHTPLKFRFMAGYSDYFPELPGGLAGGASIEPELFNGRLLGSELARLTAPYLAVPPGVAIFGGEYRWLNLAAANARGVSVAALRATPASNQALGSPSPGSEVLNR